MSHSNLPRTIFVVDILICQWSFGRNKITIQLKPQIFPQIKCISSENSNHNSIYYCSPHISSTAITGVLQVSSTLKWFNWSSFIGI